MNQNKDTYTRVRLSWIKPVKPRHCHVNYKHFMYVYVKSSMGPPEPAAWWPITRSELFQSTATDGAVGWGGELMTLPSFSLSCPELMCGRGSGQLVSAGCCLMVVLMSRAAGCMVRYLRQMATVHIPLHLCSTRLKSHKLAQNFLFISGLPLCI